MSPNLIAGLTPKAASHICMRQCKAMCCRGPIILRLTREETAAFRSHAAALGVAVKITQAPDGAGWVRFADHAGERCPMLDDVTSACRIYNDRPHRCRAFPEAPTPGCAISGWQTGDGEVGLLTLEKVKGPGV
ncbi:MAG: hypothetical protein FJ320_02160 [SAR202 cluster bacterium]|nr:hypothetical protein [SAR202 cluster bacterium]